MSTGRERTWAPGSAAVIDAMWRPGERELSTQARAVYTALFSYMGDDYTSFPKVPTLAKGTGISDRKVRYALTELESAGLIARDYQLRNGNIAQRVTYRLYPPWAPCTTCTLHGVQGCTICRVQGMQPCTECSPTLQDVQGNPAQGAAMEETHIKQPREETQLSLLPATEQPGPDPDTRGRATKKAKASKKATDDGYSPEFEDFWAAYPRRKEKGAAWRVWLTRIGKGAKPDEMITAARHYAAVCEAEGREEKYIKHAATFLGPDAHWREYLEPPETRQGGRQPGRGYVPHSKAQTQVPDMWKRKGGATA